MAVELVEMSLTGFRDARGPRREMMSSMPGWNGSRSVAASLSRWCRLLGINIKLATSTEFTVVPSPGMFATLDHDFRDAASCFVLKSYTFVQSVSMSSWGAVCDFTLSTLHSRPRHNVVPMGEWRLHLVKEDEASCRGAVLECRLLHQLMA